LESQRAFGSSLFRHTGDPDCVGSIDRRPPGWGKRGSKISALAGPLITMMTDQRIGTNLRGHAIKKRVKSVLQIKWRAIAHAAASS
jgi:hypothetical protein